MNTGLTSWVILAFVLLGEYSMAAGQAGPKPVPGDYVLHDYKFESGEMLPELRLHFVTFGSPTKGKDGHVNNAVLILHGTGGSNAQFLGVGFAGVLFGTGQPLDATKYFIIIPDNIGHGASTKPSDGLHAKFPHYCYHDMVDLQRRLLVEKLGVDHLRLVMGTSMGGMHSWLWSEMYPDFMDAAFPLASLPVQIAGRNRYLRRMVIDGITKDPDWQNGEYKSQPIRGLTSAIYTLMMMQSAPLQMQKQMPTKNAADAAFDQRVQQGLATTDANNMLYQFDASRDYDPEPKLETITTHLLAINSADDFVNPPELGIAEKQIKRVKNGRFILLPITDETRGHGTHTIASIWKDYLLELLKVSEK
ncbi:MAG: alpha/beta fold hydrolase [Acidobacteria bacterium]|nr:alpha/beta fold hydrolase [Acidobacteriota bacterium]